MLFTETSSTTELTDVITLVTEIPQVIVISFRLAHLGSDLAAARRPILCCAKAPAFRLLGDVLVRCQRPCPGSPVIPNTARGTHALNVFELD